ncbi:hypothetical protein HDF16_004755 [Granulicella aggregans]|uniref:Uncharacterized protein n=1 Tax=Granulicella aggregans TaxID=474949 RepID=A0A7W8E669_9BACT|nr:hypothetical protein [Granulicella aggregans]
MVPHRAAFGEIAALTVKHVAMRGRPDGYLSLDNVWSAAATPSTLRGTANCNLGCRRADVRRREEKHSPSRSRSSWPRQCRLLKLVGGFDLPWHQVDAVSFGVSMPLHDHLAGNFRFLIYTVARNRGVFNPTDRLAAVPWLVQISKAIL